MKRRDFLSSVTGAAAAIAVIGTKDALASRTVKPSEGFSWLQIDGLVPGTRVYLCDESIRHENGGVLCNAEVGENGVFFLNVPEQFVGIDLLFRARKFSAGEYYKNIGMTVRIPSDGLKMTVRQELDDWA